MIGKKILNYEIKSLIGEGGMGNVYLAVDEVLNRVVAIKAVLPHLAKNEHVRKRFINEAKTMARLSHKNIVKLHDYVVHDDALFLIMEHVDGEPLDEYIAKLGRAIDEDLAIEITKQVVAACDHASQNGVVHRDIKPGNIMIDKAGVVKILDFGIAKLIDAEINNLTKTGLQIGTVYYMSPEQVQGQPVTAQTDIYAIGVTLFQMVTALNPYKSYTTEFQIYNEIVKNPLPDVREYNDKCSLFINKVIQKATKKKPEDRIKNFKDFMTILEGKEKYKKIVQDKEDTGGLSSEGEFGSNPTTSQVTGPDNSSSVLMLIAGILAGVFALCGLLAYFRVGLYAQIFVCLGLGIGLFTTFLAHKKYKAVQSDVKLKSLLSIVKNARLIAGIGSVLAFIILLFIGYAHANKDTDGDGVVDSKDQCVNEYGNIYGCPDSDGDGVIDIDDNCKFEYGNEIHHGCPDSDGDGVFDDVDLCLQQYGPIENNGCPWPDSDNDGIRDLDDHCQWDFGPAENNGCPWPDADNDGVPDSKDKCPYESGKAENNGCPAGSVTFYLNTWNASEYSTITVRFNGQSRNITESFYSPPSCGASGCATFRNIEPGRHYFSASDYAHNWNGYVTITKDNCVRFKLTD